MIEVMVSMLLTAIATAGIIALYIIETRASGYSRHTTEATVLAQDEVERLRTSSVLATAPGVTELALDEHGTPGAGMFDRTYVVTPAGVGPTGLIDYDEISVSVSWDEDNNPRTVTLLARRNR